MATCLGARLRSRSDRQASQSDAVRAASLVAVGSILGAAEVAAVPLGIEFAENQIAVTGLEPGGRAVVLGVLHENQNYTKNVVHFLVEVTDDDADGVATYEHETALSLKSRFIAIDIATGASAVGVPQPELEVAAGEAPIEGALRGVGYLKLGLARADLLIVRPGVGAWKQYLVDGGPADLDGPANRTAELELTSFAAGTVDTTMSLEATLPGDVIAAINPSTLELYVSTVSE